MRLSYFKKGPIRTFIRTNNTKNQSFRISFWDLRYVAVHRVLQWILIRCQHPIITDSNLFPDYCPRKRFYREKHCVIKALLELQYSSSSSLSPVVEILIIVEISESNTEYKVAT